MDSYSDSYRIAVLGRTREVRQEGRHERDGDVRRMADDKA
jgi:hypothetical protein